MNTKKREEMIKLHFLSPTIVFDYYDGLEIITFKQLNSKNYIGLWYNEEENYNSFLYAEVSNGEMSKLKLQEMDLRDVFSTRNSVEVANPMRDGDHCKIIDGYQILFVKEFLMPEEDLPCSGSYINFIQN